MKKLLALTLILTLTLALVGCATTAQYTDSPATEPQTKAQTETVVETVAETEIETQKETKKEEDKISEEKAIKIALDHAGFKKADVTALYSELDYDDGMLRYEVDFRKDMVEYDYEIDAKTGDILSYDQDYDD